MMSYIKYLWKKWASIGLQVFLMRYRLKIILIIGGVILLVIGILLAVLGVDFEGSFYKRIFRILYKCFKKKLFVDAAGPPRKRARVEEERSSNMPGNIENEIVGGAENEELPAAFAPLANPVSTGVRETEGDLGYSDEVWDALNGFVFQYSTEDQEDELVEMLIGWANSVTAGESNEDIADVLGEWAEGNIPEDSGDESEENASEDSNDE